MIPAPEAPAEPDAGIIEEPPPPPTRTPPPPVIECTATASSDGHATIHSLSPERVTAGGTVTFGVTANDGFRLIPVGGSCPPGVWGWQRYTTGILTADCDVQFKTEPKSIRVQAWADGFQMSPPEPVLTEPGRTVTYSLNLWPGRTTPYHVGGTCPPGSWDGNRYTTGVLSQSCEVSFSSSISTVQVTATGDGHEGIIPLTAPSLRYGSQASFRVDAAEGYQVAGAVEGTCPRGDWSNGVYRTNFLSVDCTVRFRAGLMIHQVSASGDGAVVISPSGIQSVLHGDTVSFDVTLPGFESVSSVVGGTCPPGSWHGTAYTTGAILTGCTVSFATAPASACPVAPAATLLASQGGLVSPGATLRPGNITLVDVSTAAANGAELARRVWTLVASPPGATAAFIESGPSATLVVLTPGDYEAQLTVIDANGCASPGVTFPFTVAAPSCGTNPAPALQIQTSIRGASLTSGEVFQQTPVHLAVAASSSLSPATRLVWRLIANPGGVLTHAEGIATLSTDTPGTYVVEVEEIDGLSGCAGRTASIPVRVAPLPQECAGVTAFISTVDTAGNLYRFYPDTLAMQPEGHAQCPLTGMVSTMAVDRRGIGWIETLAGELVRTDTATLACEPTGFDHNQARSTFWGSTFAADTEELSSATYFVVDEGSLATMDPQTLQLRYLSQLSDRAELTWTADGRLFAFLDGETWSLAEVNRDDWTLGPRAPLEIINETVAQPIGFAFSAWGADFYFFVAEWPRTAVFKYSGTDATTTFVKWVDGMMIGAGRPPCPGTP